MNTNLTVRETHFLLQKYYTLFYLPFSDLFTIDSIKVNYYLVTFYHLKRHEINKFLSSFQVYKSFIS